MKGILGKKVGMTQIFDEQGQVTPITIIEAGPCFVAQIKRPIATAITPSSWVLPKPSQSG